MYILYPMARPLYNTLTERLVLEFERTSAMRTHRHVLFTLLLLVSLVAAGMSAVAQAPGGPPLRGVNTDPDLTWGLDVPRPEIPPKPKNYDLSDLDALEPAEPRVIQGDKELEALREKGEVVTAGSGTQDDPYIVENLHVTEFVDDPPGYHTGQFLIYNTTKHILIRNCYFEGRKTGELIFDNRFGLNLVNAKNVTVRHCRSVLNRGFHAAGGSHHNFEYCRAYSVAFGIYTGGSHHVRAYRCYVNDTTAIGIFLYNGPDNVIEECYVTDTGREGIGTHGKAPRHVYRNNFIMNCGWNGINMEGRGDDHLTEGNTVINTHYGILVMGKKGTVRGNKTFNCTQDGIILWRARECTVEDNLIVGSMKEGIWIYRDTAKNVIRNNTLIQNANGILISDGPEDGGGHVIEGNTISRFYKGILLEKDGAKGTRIANNTFSGGRNPIYGESAIDIAVTGNTFTHCLHGVRTIEGTGWTVDKNTFRFIGTPVQFIKSADCSASGNTSTMAYYSSFHIRNSERIAYRGNTIRGSRTSGIRLDGATDCSIEGNTIEECGGHAAWTGTGGIRLANTGESTVAENTLRNNIAQAIRFRENCTGNVLKDNVYKNNPVNVEIPEATREKNTIDTEEKVIAIPDDERRAKGLPPR